MLPPRLLPLLVAVTACSPVAGRDDTIQITVDLRLAGDRDVGATPVKVYVYSGQEPVPRHVAYRSGVPRCDFDVTPFKSCTIAVQTGETVTLMVAEGDPAVFVRFDPASKDDTLRDGSFVEFIGWTDCPDAADRGLCILRPTRDVRIEGNVQLMQQVSVYQRGAARMDWITFAAAPMLKVPAESYNILDLAGCRRVYTPPAAPCDSVRLVGHDPWHRFTAYVPRQTIVGMFPVDGAQTEFVGWDGDCILSPTFGGGVCSIVTPNVAGDPIVLTLLYQWWECETGPSDRDLPGQDCILTGGVPWGSSNGGSRSGK